MRVLVCGGRDYSDWKAVRYALDELHIKSPITLVIQGGAQGVDAFAGGCALSRGVPERIFKADWTKHGRAAGPIRNKQMLEEGKPDLVVAFPGGRGTADMVRQARAAGVPVVR